VQDLQKLIRGFKRFQRQFFKPDNALFEQLKTQQNPKILIVGCSDSRVDPAIITKSRPGDLFVIRNVANLVPPYEPDTKYHGVSSALEYAVRILQVDHIIVMGHSNCGGIDALMRGSEQIQIGEFIDHWVDIARPAKEAVLRDMAGKPLPLQRKACEEAAILISLENLLTFPWLVERVNVGNLAIHGWYFDLEAGEMLSYNPETASFEKLTDER
jgi:carbonic anhydrase